MPELPEVETLRRALEHRLQGKTVQTVVIHYTPLVRQPSAEALSQVLPGQRLEAVQRRGKYLLWQWTDYTLVVHLRMEGKFWFGWSEHVQAKHVHAVLTFTDGTVLLYQDVRKFGTWDLVPKGKLHFVPVLEKLGPEPLATDFTPERLARQLAGHARSMIKSALLNQQVVAGLGNIYVDEALFLAKIHPERRVGTLQRRHVKSLHAAMVDVLQRGLAAGGASVRTYRHSNGEEGGFQHQLSVYGREGEPCRRCGQPIRRIVVAGRGTHFCPRCQRLPRSR